MSEPRDFVSMRLDWEMRDRALHLGYARSQSMNHRDTLHSKNMLHGRPNWWKHYVGALGEVLFSHWTGLEVDSKTIGRGDDGSDFPGGIQVKSSDIVTCPNLMFTHIVWNRKCRNPETCKKFVLVWINEAQERGYLIGAITRERAEPLRHDVDHGHGPTWQVDWGHLDPITLHFPPPDWMQFLKGCHVDDSIHS